MKTLFLMSTLVLFPVLTLAFTDFNSNRTICDKDDMISIENASDEIKEMSTPIGIWNINGERKRGGMCTGTLIGKDLFLTAEHCSDECKNITVTFGYWKDGVRKEETFPCRDIVEKGDGKYENDYLIVRLEGNPGVNLGWYTVSSKKLKKNDPLLMIHHPGGSPMKVSQKNCKLYEQTQDFVQHKCDTMPGSSGSAILSPDFTTPSRTRIVGVHTLGGCSSEADSYNSGPSIAHLVNISPALKALDD